MTAAVRDTRYYDYTKLLSYNSLIALVIGIRGVGKTYGAKKLAINDYLKSGYEFIYLRRHKSDLVNVNTFFRDIEHEYPDWEFRVDGRKAQIRSAGTEDKWITFGYFLALSNAATVKSVAYPNVKRVIFDEFLLSKGYVKYLPNEYHAFLEFLNTVDRHNDRVRVLMLANSVDLANPYFLVWHVQPDGSGIRKYAKGLVVADFPESAEYADHARGSMLGRLTAGTDYEKYAVGNEFVAGSTTLTGDKPSDAKYIFTLDHGGIMLSFWWDASTWHVSRRKVKEPRMYALTVRQGADESAIILEPRNSIVTSMRSAYRMRMMRFDDAQVHTAFQNILAFLNTK